MAAADFGFLRIKVIALAVTDKHRAHRFYSETLGLEPAYEGTQKVGYFLGTTILMLKSDWYGTPTEQPNPRITIATAHAPDTAATLAARGVRISDPVQTYDDGFNVGSFLDSEGNKLWFCSPASAEETVQTPL
jgi:catechol-2,3-dioxygenase